MDSPKTYAIENNTLFTRALMHSYVIYTFFNALRIDHHHTAN